MPKPKGRKSEAAASKKQPAKRAPKEVVVV